MTEWFWIVRTKRQRKAATYRIFKRLSPAMTHINKAHRERGTEAQVRKFQWEEGL